LCQKQLALDNLTHQEGQLILDMQECLNIVASVRSFRTDKRIPNRDKLSAGLSPTSDFAFWQKMSPVLCHLAGLLPLQNNLPEGNQWANLVQGRHELFLEHTPTAEDSATERAKLLAELGYQEGFLNSVRNKLANERFVQNAKPEVVAAERKKEADALEKISILQAALAKLE
jgi:valyl-tRNA synthetase